MLNDKFYTFSAVNDGGGIGYFKGTVHTISGTNLDVRDTVATLGSGGVMFIQGTDATITILTSTFLRSTCGSSGAWAYIKNTGFITMTMTTVTFTTFNAGIHGGLAYMEGTALTMSKTSVTTTTTKALTGSGGHYYFLGTSSSITIKTSTFTTATAAVSGGAYYIINTGPVTLDV